MKLIISSLILLFSSRMYAAGAVIGEPGACIMEFGIYTAHFTIYQSDTRGNEEFCEDLPDTGNTLFVMDYLHGSLKDVPVDFRIIRDIEDWGIFARWDNVAAIEDIDARTVYYQSGAIKPDNRLEVEHNFLEPGGYIGVVTAPHPTKDLNYQAVFPFQVGRFNVLPWLMGLAALVAVAAYFWKERRSA